DDEAVHAPDRLGEGAEVVLDLGNRGIGIDLRPRGLVAVLAVGLPIRLSVFGRVRRYRRIGRRLFADGWPKTLIKAALLAGAYSFTLVVAFSTVAALIFVL
ncbi:MAG: hypothetical protein IAE82_02890, partial [Opitutaceae bacterium]|nr:hypothetical protein [Opitutaceae bacterium]